MCEVSTGVLCVLANFDDEQGVPGLGQAFPMTKVVIGAVFVVLFILCRCVLWPTFSYYFCRDVLLALKGNDTRTSTRRGWLKFFLVSLTGLSILQVAWLGQIFVIAGEELTKVGLL
jgi:TLC domain